MEEKEITWQQIDAELETIMNEFTDMLIIIDKKVKTLKEKMNNVKKPSEEDLEWEKYYWDDEDEYYEEEDYEEEDY